MTLLAGWQKAGHDPVWPAFKLSNCSVSSRYPYRPSPRCGTDADIAERAECQTGIDRPVIGGLPAGIDIALVGVADRQDRAFILIGDANTALGGKFSVQIVVDRAEQRPVVVHAQRTGRLNDIAVFIVAVLRLRLDLRIAELAGEAAVRIADACLGTVDFEIVLVEAQAR